MTTIKNSMEISQKTRNATIIWSSNPIADTFPKEKKSVYHRNTCICMFIMALFTITKI